MFHKAVPVLPTKNIRATIDFYENRLGFTGINFGSHAILKTGNAEIQFYLVDQNSSISAACCCIYTDNLSDLYTSLAEKDLSFVTGQMMQSGFGKKEFTIVDNNGNMIRFVQQEQ